MAGYRILCHNNDAAILQMRNYLSLPIASITCRYVQHVPKDNIQRPKRPPNRFIMYINSIREQLKHEDPTINMKELVKKGSKQWSTLDNSKKLIFKQQYDEMYEQYLKDLEAYKEHIERYGITETPFTVKKLHKEQKNLGRPKKPPTAYGLYFISVCQENKSSVSGQELAKIASKKWKEMSDVDKEKYMEEAKQLRETYHKAVKEWEEKMIQSGRADVVRASTRLSSETSTKK